MHARHLETGSRRRALLLTLLLFAVGLAGCAGDQPQAALPPPGDGDVVELPSGFAVEGLRILDQHDNETLHEDDHARILYVLRHPGAPDEPLTRFVSLLLDGKVVWVENLRLEPGESREFEYDLGVLHGRSAITAEVRISPISEVLESTVLAWPRTAEDIEWEGLTLRVDHWLDDAENDSTIVNMTLARPPEAPAFGALRAHILCLDEQGVVHAQGEVHPESPAPGELLTQDVVLPACEHSTYGVGFTFELDGQAILQRVLFVEHGWQPPDA